MTIPLIFSSAENVLSHALVSDHCTERAHCTRVGKTFWECVRNLASSEAITISLD
jgi:hypothetical protein